MNWLDDPAALRMRLADALHLIERMLADRSVAPFYRPACNKLLAGTSIAALRDHPAGPGGTRDARGLLRGS